VLPGPWRAYAASVVLASRGAGSRMFLLSDSILIALLGLVLLALAGVIELRNRQYRTIPAPPRLRRASLIVGALGLLALVLAVLLRFV
jgi:hypothetical protein